MKKENGITLIALVISIIVLIILASVAINTLINNGIIDKAKTATQEYKNAQNYEETQISKYTNEIDSQVNSDRGTVTISEEEYQKLQKKGTWELLASNTSATYKEVVINNIEKYSSICFMTYNNTEIYGSNEVPVSKILSGDIAAIYGNVTTKMRICNIH